MIKTMMIKKSMPTLMDVFQPFFQTGFMTEATARSTGDFRPAASTIQGEQGVTLLLSLPGLSREEVQLKLEGSVLQVSGTRKAPLGQEQDRLSGEISFGNFSRSFQLAENLDAQAIEARMEHGMLHIQIPFKNQVLPKQIEIG